LKELSAVHFQNRQMVQGISRRNALNQSVCSVYLPSSRTWNCNDFLSLVSELPPPVLLMGGFNSHSTLWGCSSTNQKGPEMEKFLMQSNLYLLNNKSVTYLHPQLQ
jgi:Endonuclease-reverse transcriptase